MVDAASADLSAFHARGGKLILFMGWDDPVGAAMDIVGYHDRIAHREDFVRLYMVPGMWHCAEGAGATNFSTATRDSVPPVSDARHDMAKGWRTGSRREEPREIVATKFEGRGGASRQGRDPLPAAALRLAEGRALQGRARGEGRELRLRVRVRRAVSPASGRAP